MRDLAQIQQNQYDLIIIGGGINGAGVARDAALRGLKTILIGKGDFASGTSSWSTRLIHGGLRYLEYFEFPLVRESLKEREILLHTAPHLVTPLLLTIPILILQNKYLFLIGNGIIILARFILICAYRKNYSKIMMLYYCSSRIIWIIYHSIYTTF